MGIYPDHGVEYWIFLKNKTEICVVNLRKADTRLVSSKYYEQRKDTWWANWQTRRIPISDLPDFDMELTTKEKESLAEKLQCHGDQVESHGWYDVFSICDSY